MRPHWVLQGRLAAASAVALTSCAVLCAAASASCGAASAGSSSGTEQITCSAGSGTVDVPDHVGGVTIQAFGGAGGEASDLSPYVGAGGSGQGTLAEAGPFVLTVDVGSAGDVGPGGIGGTPGGGNGGGGGGGGGYTQVYDQTSSTLLMTAGGGGGTGGSNSLGTGGDGGDGNSPFAPDGQPGGDCISSSCGAAFTDGGGATTTAPGAGDSHGPIDGNPGVGSDGGAGGSASGGGGGGGGCFGGGGGGTDQAGATDGGGGGGGGSTCLDAPLTNLSYPPVDSTGDGSVTVIWTVPAAPSITSTSSAGFTLGSQGSFQITATGTPASTISLDDPGELASGLSFSGGTGTATISGTPTGSPSSVQLTVRASNGVSPDATQQLTINVAGVAPSITSATSASFVVGTPGSFQLSATGEPAPTATIADPGDLPAGLLFDQVNDTISGSPTGSPGKAQITVGASNGVSPDATQTLNVDVTAPAGTQSSGGGYVNIGGSGSGTGSGGSKSAPVQPKPGGKIGVTIGCAGASGTTCKGQVGATTLEKLHPKKGKKGKKGKKMTLVVGLAKYTIHAGQVKVLTVKLNRAGQALLKRLHRMTVKVVIAVSTVNGLKHAATKTVTLKQAKKKKKRKRK
jgi:hypothetical protein